MYRILICDDEPILRRGLASFVDWQALDCSIVGEASDGSEALDLIDRLDPDILIADIRMPGPSGLELAERLALRGARTRVILLTAHSEFQYAKKAVSLGVVDYILKSEASESIAGAVERAIEQLRLGPVGDGAEAERLLYRLVTGAEKDPRVAIGAERRFGFDFSSFKVAAVAGEETWCPDQKEGLPTFRPHLRLTGAILPGTEGPEGRIDLVVPKEFSVGLSRVYSGWKNLPRAWEEALSALDGVFYHPEARIQEYSPPEAPDPSVEAIDRVVEDYRRALANQDLSTALAVVDEAARTCAVARTEPGRYRSLVFLFFSLALNHFRRLSAKHEPGTRIIQDSLAGQSAPELRSALGQFLSGLFTHLDPRRRFTNDLVAKVDLYIEEHFHENLSLDDLAAVAALSPSYLSRLFASETGRTIQETIHQRKLEKAKQLLASTDLKAAVISLMIGIEDPAYFSHFFRKHAGLTPTEYRHSLLGGEK